MNHIIPKKVLILIKEINSEDPLVNSCFSYIQSKKTKQRNNQYRFLKTFSKIPYTPWQERVAKTRECKERKEKQRTLTTYETTRCKTQRDK